MSFNPVPIDLDAVAVEPAAVRYWMSPDGPVIEVGEDVFIALFGTPRTYPWEVATYEGYELTAAQFAARYPETRPALERLGLGVRAVPVASFRNNSSRIPG